MSQKHKTPDWRRAGLLRLGFHCKCERCLADLGPISKRSGKFWQAKYGESNKDFRKRYLDSHKGPGANK